MRVATVASKSGYSVSKKVNQISPVDNSNYQSGFSFSAHLAKTKSFTSSKNKILFPTAKTKKPIIFINR
jgi:hypothetical protein